MYAKLVNPKMHSIGADGKIFASYVRIDQAESVYPELIIGFEGEGGAVFAQDCTMSISLGYGSVGLRIDTQPGRIFSSKEFRKIDKLAQELRKVIEDKYDHYSLRSMLHYLARETIGLGDTTAELKNVCNACRTAQEKETKKHAIENAERILHAAGKLPIAAS